MRAKCIYNQNKIYSDFKKNKFIYTYMTITFILSGRVFFLVFFFLIDYLITKIERNERFLILKIIKRNWKDWT